MLLEIFFIVFFFFTCEQIHAGFHFNGRSTLVPIILVLFGFFNLYKSILFLYYVFTADSVLHAAILLLISIVVTTVINTLFANKAKKQFQQAGGINLNAPVFADIHFRKRDIMITVTALWGVLVNTVLLLVFR